MSEIINYDDVIAFTFEVSNGKPDISRSTVLQLIEYAKDNHKDVEYLKGIITKKHELSSLHEQIRKQYFEQAGKKDFDHMAWYNTTRDGLVAQINVIVNSLNPEIQKLLGLGVAARVKVKSDA